MLTVGEARNAILGAIPTLEAESIPANSATGRVLRQSVVAERDQPPFDRVMMDGIAIAFSEFDAGMRHFPIQSTQAAGDERHTLAPGSCIEIMTGASLPAGADCIVPVERIAVADGVATIEDGYSAETKQFIHPQGSDHMAGSTLLPPGKRITPMDIAVINSCGLTEVDVGRMPAIRIISTGNELVPAGQPIEPHQIRLSNGPAVIAMLQQHGYTNCEHDHLPDEIELLEKRVGEHLDASDVLILSGGVSMGKADSVPQVLKNLDLWGQLLPELLGHLPGSPPDALNKNNTNLSKKIRYQDHLAEICIGRNFMRGYLYDHPRFLFLLFCGIDFTVKALLFAVGV